MTILGKHVEIGSKKCSLKNYSENEILGALSAPTPLPFTEWVKIKHKTLPPHTHIHTTTSPELIGKISTDFAGDIKTVPGLGTIVPGVIGGTMKRCFPVQGFNSKELCL